MQKRDLIVAAVIAVAFFAFFSVSTKSGPDSWNDRGRMAGIESIAERGTWSIDDSPWQDQTQDKVFLNGKFYSDKMPLMTLMGAGMYAVLHYGLGASLAPDCSTTARLCAYSWLTRIFIALPAALLMGLYFLYARRLSIPIWVALLGTLALGLGTLLFPFTAVFNHHVPGAASLFASFYILTWSQRSDRSALFLAGLLAALAVSFDVLSGVFAAVMFAIALVRYRSGFTYFVAGAAIPVLLTAILDYQIAGTLLPPYMVTNGYDYPGSAFPATFAGNGTPDDYPAYAFRMFLGGKGLFAFNPLLLFAFAGALAVAFRREHPLRVEGIAVALGFVALCVYLATNTGNYGGMGYGERWFIVSVPTLFAFIFFAPPLNATTPGQNTAAWENILWLVFLPLLALSIFSSWQGVQAPWQDWLPPLQMTRSNQFPVFGFKWNVKFW